MKQLYAIVLACLCHMGVFAQAAISGRVSEKETGLPVANATVSISRSHYSVTDENGYFRFPAFKEPNAVLTVSAIGYKTFSLQVSSGDNPEIQLEKIHLLLQPIEIKTVRAGERSPFTRNDISRREIEKINTGQDLPMLLNSLPSVVTNSDAGNGVGYTAMRIRGTDATRINVTLNGIPYNDAESQGTFFVNMPDFVSSVSSIQVQRGVGTSSNGAGAFGATINMSTNEFIEKPYGELNNSYGSFNTWKNTVKAGTGLIDGKFTLDARLSSITSDGYIERATSDLKSFYLSGAYFTGKASFRVNVFSGREKTYHAWNGIPEDMLKINRRYNSAGTEKPGTPYENETDNYRQDHYQLFYNQGINSKFSFNTALFLTRGKGYYEQYKAGRRFSDFGLPGVTIGDSVISRTDVVRQLFLDNYYYGGILSLQYKHEGTQWITGGGWNKYDGKHYGRLPWAQVGVPVNYEWYNLDAFKTDLNFYTKLQQRIAAYWELFGDIQYRTVSYEMNGFRDNPDLKVKQDYHFINPKAGISYSRQGWNAYFSYALANKEPNRDDFEAGATLQPKQETLHDFELGLERRDATFGWSATLFYMKYVNQLVLTGKINDVGAYARTNIPDSYRMGVELQAKWQPVSWLNVNGNIALSRNRIKNYTTWYDDYDDGVQKTETFSETDISFSPSVVGGADISFVPLKNWEISFPGKYVSRQYLDNTGNKGRSLDPFYVQNFRTAYTLNDVVFREVNFILQVNNLFNKRYEPNGYTFSYIAGGEFIAENYYFPMAGTNFTFGINIRL
ncbi:MAG: TonB-dependent receptor [Chitinophagaceae bacterium]|nr:TonB-dependent receptor [Chitinophagaceae bacterium]MCW5928369.1 TonB-dependent receptor [Chitinophagaceae bacterium]